MLATVWPHFLNLLQKSWDSFLSALGTTGLGWWVQGIIWFFATEIATYLVVWITRGKAAMKDRAMQNFKIGLYAWLLVMVFVYVPIFGWNVVKTVYSDHQSLVSRVGTIKQERDAALKKNQELTDQVKEKQQQIDQNASSKRVYVPNAERDNQEEKQKREVQHRLSEYINSGLFLQGEWNKRLGGTEDVQRQSALDIQNWNKAVENYLKTIPRGEIYVVRFRNPARSGGTYPVGINVNLAGTYDLLLSDLARLNEFITDPNLGKP
jgi:hypothetical protein